MKIWRGDRDQFDIRKLKFCIQTCAGLHTTLINSGKPLAIQQQGFSASLQKHSVGGWNTSHFLSFSKNKAIAAQFAIGNSGKSLMPTTQFGGWETAVIEIDLSALNLVRSFQSGVDHYVFNEIGLGQTLIQLSLLHRIGFEEGYRSRRKDNWPIQRNIFVIDVYAYLSYLQKCGDKIDPVALANSQYEEEVLIFPVDPLWGSVGLTAQIDFGCVSQIEYFQLL